MEKIKNIVRKTIKEEISKKSEKSPEEIKTELPTQKMIDWFDFEFNQKPDNMDFLESDMWSSNQQENFLDHFESELAYLDYDEKIRIYMEAGGF